MTELERNMAALDFAKKALEYAGQIDAITRINEILCPAPVNEPVAEKAEETTAKADMMRMKRALDHALLKLAYEGFTDTVRALNAVRDPAPVERSITVDVIITEMGDVSGLGESTFAFKDHPEFYGCIGLLTFTTTDKPIL